MYVGTTTQGRADHFIVLEKGDQANAVQELMLEKNVNNLIISKEIKDDNFLGNPDFKAIFQQIEILYLKDIEIKESEQLYVFKNLKRLEIINCSYKTKEAIDWLNFVHLTEIIAPYSKRFINLFDHPKLKMIMLDHFNELGFVFPENKVLETVSIEKSKTCDWNSLTNISNLTSLYLVKIPTLQDISWISQFSKLKNIDFTSCKNIENCIENIAEVRTLESIYLSYMGDFETLVPLKKLKHLKEFTIESGGKLIDNKNVDFLNEMPNLEFGIDMRNCKTSNNCY